MTDETPQKLTPKEARQGTRPSAMFWVLVISTVTAFVAMYLVLAAEWGIFPWG